MDNRPIHRLLIAIAETFRIDRFVEWLAKLIQSGDT